jgi:hypothetical protein
VARHGPGPAGSIVVYAPTLVSLRYEPEIASPCLFTSRTTLRHPHKIPAAIASRPVRPALASDSPGARRSRGARSVWPSSASSTLRDGVGWPARQARWQTYRPRSRGNPSGLLMSPATAPRSGRKNMPRRFSSGHSDIPNINSSATGGRRPAGRLLYRRTIEH